MTDLKAWIEERRAIQDSGVPFSARDSRANFPRALDALNAVLEQVERMEIDAKTYGAAGHDYASESLAAYAGTLRQAIEGAIIDQS